MRLEKDQKDAWKQILLRRVQGEDAQFPISIENIEQGQLEGIAEEAIEDLEASDIDNPQKAVWEVIGREAAENVDHDAIAREAARDREAAEDIDYDTIAREAAKKIDYDKIARRASEAVVTSRESVDHHQTAIYKTQLQKGGRISVPDAEIRALSLEPGDTLQIRLTHLESTGE